jgi:hypothetical protein
LLGGAGVGAAVPGPAGRAVIGQGDDVCGFRLFPRRGRVSLAGRGRPAVAGMGEV